MSRLDRFLLPEEWCLTWPNCDQIDSLKHRVSELDQKGEEEVLSGDEEGDANSKYFHSVLAGRRRGNVISMIQVGEVTLEGVAPIRRAVFSHFVSHFENTNMGRLGVGNLQFKSYKSPGPGGINFGFIKDFWDELRGDVMRFIPDFYRNDKLTKDINSTFIALIPKFDSLQRLNDFRPISLVGNLYKILAKVLANRLRLVIGSVISGSQTTFVKDRGSECVDEGDGSTKLVYGSWANIRALRAVIMLFETMSGLRILGKPLGLAGKLFAYERMDREGMWFRVLAARYGVDGGRLRDRGRRGSSWWREIDGIREGGGESGGGWFAEHVSRRVGDGSDTFFWTYLWVDGTPLCERFGRLYALAETKRCTVAEMFSLGWGRKGRLGCGGGNRWMWQPDRDTCYIVQGAYQLLITHDSVHMDDAEHLIWHPRVPLKVSVFAWRLLRDSLPTKSNLITRGMLSPAAYYFVSGCGVAEAAHHLFISCSTFSSLWTLVRSWIGISAVDPISVRDHFVQFTHSTSGSQARRSFLQLIWLASVVEVDECYFSFKLP
ncbi:hypothetical protein TSUD_181970 [Trifolium subterraneum]|uniref:Reverse transcriptase zinc-binding domain-containing protein n=1 Tax=Trifolium subterraneum TaxID=3900 RepID=A0A2Z6PR31_TRISU|nr:hypothetical protein TSUD_181970 [Trifolium subterraneum]